MSTIRTQPTLKDVAKLAGCSTAVVSTVINSARGNTAVGPEMRDRVESAALQLGYRPNFASRSLARRTTRTLGVYIPPAPWSGPSYSYEGGMLRGAESACRATGYDLLIINFTGSQPPEACGSKFAEGRIDGLLLLHAEPGSPWIGELLRTSRNIVGVDYSNPEPDLHAMVFDNPAVGRLAVEHLVSLGHRRIGFLGSCKYPPSVDGKLRQDGFMQAMAAHKIDVAPAWIFDSSRLPAPIPGDAAVCQLEGQLGVEYFLTLPKAQRPTAIVAYCDLAAVFAVKRLQKAGQQLPRDMSILGVDDSDWCQMVEPNLTSIAHPLEEMGKRAAELLISRSEPAPNKGRSKVMRDASETVHEYFPPGLVVRGSTAAPGSAAR